MKCVVYTEVLEKDKLERWYYGTYANEQVADDVAYNLGHIPEDGIWHSWCRFDEVNVYKVKNMPIN